MADNNPHTPEPVDTKRWGGPGSSHQDRTKEPPAFADPREGGPTNPPTSQVSGGGGERDLKHCHDDAHRSSKGSKGEPPAN